MSGGDPLAFKDWEFANRKELTEQYLSELTYVLTHNELAAFLSDPLDNLGYTEWADENFREEAADLNAGEYADEDD